MKGVRFHPTYKEKIHSSVSWMLVEENKTPGQRRTDYTYNSSNRLFASEFYACLLSTIKVLDSLRSGFPTHNVTHRHPSGPIQVAFVELEARETCIKF